VTTTSDNISLLEKVFPGISPEVLGELASIVRVRTYPPGTVLCHDGEIETVFYVVHRGRVEVTKQLEGDQVRVLNHHGPGEFFGEIALIQNSRRIATVRTVERTTVLELDKVNFDDFLARSPAVGLALMRQVALRLRDSDQTSIAELRKMNAELTAAYRYLAEQERLRTQFLSAVSRELRGPLSVAKGQLQLLRSSAAAPGRDEAVETVYRQIDKVVNLVNNLLFMQEMTMIDLDFEVVSMGELVSRAVEAHRSRARDAGVQLLIVCAIMPPLVSGDAEALGIALSAVIDNAVKFSSPGMEVTLRLGLTGDGRGATVAIEDHGPGIPVEHQALIFERFKGYVPGAPITRGLGLGLPIARYLVEKHGGTLTVQSAPGQGATFALTLPVHHA